MKPWIGYFGYERSPWDRFIAYLCAIFSLLAGIGVLSWISPGYTLVGETTQYSITYVHEHRFYWRLGWFLVLAATTLQLIFFSIVTNRIRPGVGPLGSSVLVVGGFGIIAVWVCALVGIMKMPAMAEELLLLHRQAQATLVQQHYYWISMPESMGQHLVLVGNTFLWIAGLLLNLLCLRDPRYPRWLWWFSLLPWAAGATMTAGARAFANDPELRLYGAVAYVPLFALWAFAMGLFYLDVGEGEKAPPPRPRPAGPVLAPRLRGD